MTNMLETLGMKLEKKAHGLIVMSMPVT
ncbi:thioesterase, partial [Staphylococcus succinus]